MTTLSYKSENEVKEMLERESGSWACGRVADNQGYNEAYIADEIDNLLDTLPEYEYAGSVPANSDNVDIDVWAQELTTETRENLRHDLAEGHLYIARFTSDTLGSLDLLLWD